MFVPRRTIALRDAAQIKAVVDSPNGSGEAVRRIRVWIALAQTFLKGGDAFVFYERCLLIVAMWLGAEPE